MLGIGQAVALWHRTYEANRHAKYHADGGRTAGLLKPIVRAVGLERLPSLLAVFFRDPRRRSFDCKSFAAVWTECDATAQREAQDAGEREAREREARERDQGAARDGDVFARAGMVAGGKGR